MHWYFFIYIPNELFFFSYKNYVMINKKQKCDLFLRNVKYKFIEKIK